jgi:CheY-like chemotaxis protein
MSRRILLVDDDPILLDTMRQLLEEEYELTTALGPAAGLAAIEPGRPYAVVVSDLQMPGMNGTTFLARVRVLSPDSIRVILTGCGNLEAAVQAVNEGQIFRFLTKPCPYETLRRTLDACLEQYRLIRAERDLLQGTLAGSIHVMSEILALVNPGAFGQATRIRHAMRHMAEQLGLEDVWQYEIAGLLSQIGCVSVSPEILHKTWAGQNLTPEESRMIEAHPALAGELLGHIPRLETIAGIITRQNTPPNRAGKDDDAAVVLGGSMLRLALALDQLLAQGMALERALGELRRCPRHHPLHLLNALETLQPAGHGMVPRMVTVRQLETFMVLDEDVYARNDMLIACRGHEVTTPMIHRFRSFVLGVGVREPFRVLMPANGEIRLAA